MQRRGFAETWKKTTVVVPLKAPHLQMKNTFL
jgi:hypothetical protein